MTPHMHSFIIEHGITLLPRAMLQELSLLWLIFLQLPYSTRVAKCIVQSCSEADAADGGFPYSQFKRRFIEAVTLAEDRMFAESICSLNEHGALMC